MGYGRPPQATRWKPGESGNPRKKRKPQESTVETIDRLLLSRVKLTINGETKSVTALEAIVSQLQLKEIAGNVRASRILLRYKEFASRHALKDLQLLFVDSPYTRALADLPSGDRDVG